MKQRRIYNHSIHNYWKLFTKKPLPIFKDWLAKEKFFLRRNIKKDSKVLDAGCGIGKHIKLLANTAKEISGVDFDKNVVDEAKKNLSIFKNVKIFFENAKKLHFKNNIFDFVICMGNSFGDFGENTSGVLKEMKRVIKPDGKIIISVYSEKALGARNRQYKKIGIKIKKVDLDGTVYTEDKLALQQFSKVKLNNIFKKVGLSVNIVELNPVSYICEAVKK